MAKDKFSIPLKYPSCVKVGEAHCWQEDGWAYVKGDRSTQVTEVTTGFKRVQKPSNWGEDINFICDDCGELSAKI
ncbi:hypothetical protein [Candidatus Thiodiazotropha endoloripes]|uniref:hypothetical protein n=1 Tax=Candidatus Thiodiazotropha endoloripes TaxID=1818881 RepID=UPI001112924A|nr:hypothetical protein [Candidatus Thiodiazotropha endoloripes]MCG7984641.1 hypothetical protein [Candidatus Thiodiazotropha lotti]